ESANELEAKRAKSRQAVSDLWYKKEKTDSWRLPKEAEAFLSRLDDRLDEIEALAPELEAMKSATSRSMSPGPSLSTDCDMLGACSRTSGQAPTGPIWLEPFAPAGERVMSSPVASQFWELHRRLGECYQVDLQTASNAWRMKRLDSENHMEPGFVGPVAPEPPPFAPSLMLPNSSFARVRSNDEDLRSGTKECLMSRQSSILSQDKNAADKNSARVSAKITRFVDKAFCESDVGICSKDASKSDEEERDAADFAPRACWDLENITPAFTRRKTGPMPARSATSLCSLGSNESLRIVTEIHLQKSRECSAIHPHATFKICWDMLGMMFLLRDLIFIPLQLFDRPAIIDSTDMMSLLFWTADIVLSFFTGYYEKGRLELHLKKAVCNYLRTWCVLDIGVVATDWWLQIQPTTGADGLARVTKSIRSARFLRMFRLIRLSKMSKVSHLLREQISTEAGMIYFGIILVILRMSLLQHIIACGWFGVGVWAQEEENASWIKEQSIKDRTFLYQYTTCLHWAFAQLGMGSVEIEATTTVERLFCICVAFTGLISFSTLVSTVTSLMSNLQKAQDQEQQLFRDLRRFLNQNDIPLDLSQRVQRFLQHAYRARTSRTADSEVAIFALLSKSLNAELQFTRYKTCLHSLALLMKLLASDETHYQAETVAQKLAVKALITVQVAQNDLIFNHGTVAQSCYFTVEDGHQYVQGSKKQPVAGEELVAEVSLWVPWAYVGDLISKGMSRGPRAGHLLSPESRSAESRARNISTALNGTDVLSDLWHYHVEDTSQDASLEDFPAGPQELALGMLHSWRRFTQWAWLGSKKPRRPTQADVVPDLS
ncbi:unnamed protein product, partial [Effrenium voratum]